MHYAERPSVVPGAVIWTKAATPGQSRILPDGCVDLIWDGGRLFVAGPDSTARWQAGRSGEHYTALRFSDGLGPAVLGVPARAIRDRTPQVADIWSESAARDLVEQVAVDPVAALERWLWRRVQDIKIDAFGAAAFALASSGCSAAEMAVLSGYADQTHLTRDVRELAGITPGRLLRELAG